MPRITPPPPTTPEATIANMVARGDSPAAILKYAQRLITSPGGRAVAAKKGHMAELGRRSGASRRAKAKSQAVENSH